MADADTIVGIMCIVIFITREWYLYHVYIEFLKRFLRSLVEFGLMGAAHKAAPGRVGFTAEALWPSSS